MIGVVRNPGELIHLRKADGPLAMLCDVEPSGAWFVRDRAAFNGRADKCPDCEARANQTTGRETVTP